MPLGLGLRLGPCRTPLPGVHFIGFWAGLHQNHWASNYPICDGQQLGL